MLGLQCSEKRLFSSEDLNGGCWALGEVQQTAGMTDQLCSDDFTDHRGQVWCNGSHSGFEVVKQLCTVGGDGENLVAEEGDVQHIRVRDLSSHGDLSGRLELGFKLFGEDGRKICRCSVSSETNILKSHH
jgi:hypothetical protein